jgi:hypothetical protein
MALWLNVCLQVTKKSGAFRTHPCSRDQEFGRWLGHFGRIGKGFLTTQPEKQQPFEIGDWRRNSQKKRMRQFCKVDIPLGAIIEALKMGD